MTNTDHSNGNSFGRVAALFAGPLVAVIIALLPPPSGLEQKAWYLVAVTSWMVIWWLTEAIPLAATALLPIPFMPMLGIGTIKATTQNYAHPLIFLFLGGFMLSAAMQKTGLHKRIALTIIMIVGTSGPRIIAGFMLATALLSMWISNTATTLMMFAVGLSIIQTLEAQSDDQAEVRRFGVMLMLGIAYSASIGGIGTLIGTPPNALLASVLESSYQIEIDFLTWMMFGVPIVFVLLPITWLLLTKLMFRGHPPVNFSARGVLQSEMSSLGAASRGEMIVLVVFLLAALGWVFGKKISALTGIPLSDTSVALIAALLLFVFPISLKRREFLLDWETAVKIPWGVLLIFGGGLAIASGFSSTGLAEAVGTSMKSLDHVNIWVFVLLSCTLIVMLTEVTSNTASAATFLPIFATMAVGLGHDPRLLTIPIALGASMAFMMPVATPPNAIVFSYKGLTISDMVRVGIWLNIVAIIVSFAAVYFLSGIVFGL